MLARLRAALTPGAVLLLAALLLMLGASAGGQPLEKRVARTLSQMEGAGRVTVTIRTQRQAGAWGTAGAQETPCGAVAIAQGADDPLVEMQLRQALCALLGIPDGAVSILTGGK